MPGEKPSHPPRRYLRVSVRALILFVLLFGAATGWIVRSARIQRAAALAIKKDCVSLLYDWQRYSGKPASKGTPRAPAWLTDLIGVDYFGHVTDVAVNARATDKTFKHLGRLNRLEKLVVLNRHRNSNVDSKLAHLTGLTELTELDLSSVQVTDAGLAHLKGLRNLDHLLMIGTRVTTAGIADLKRALPKLDVTR
jgi:internalin A